MAAVQTTIPFRSRKKTRLSSNCKTDENIDILNKLQPLKGKVLRRRLRSDLKENQENGENFTLHYFSKFSNTCNTLLNKYVRTVSIIILLSLA